MERKSNFQQAVIFLLIVFAFLFSGKTAEACSCAKSPTVDVALDMASNVAVLKVQAVEKYQDSEEGYGYGGIKQTTLKVEKVFKGNLKVGQELVFRQGGGGDCIWTFSEKSVGSKYLLYLGDKPDDNLWMAFTCSRSGTLDYAAQDLLYLEKLSRKRHRTRLSGILTHTVAASVEGEQDSYNRLAGKKVSIVGNGKKVEVKTDKNGIYEIYDLPAGNYTITPEKIDGYKFAGENAKSLAVEIEAKSHTEQNFNFTINNRIRGKILDTSGNPLKDVCLRLRPAIGKAGQNFYQNDCTNENGIFNFDTIAAGTYVIVINEGGEISADEPFPQFYYPNALNLEEAAKITVGAGDFFDDLAITVQPTVETVTLSGVLMFSDGKPIENETVDFSSENKKGNWADTDAEGRFRIKALKGQKGKLTASMYSYVGEFENCLELDKIIRASGENVPRIETTPVEVEAINDLSGIEVKFPFPSCKKAEDEEDK